MRLLLVLPFVLTFASANSNFFELATVNNRTLLVGLFSAETNELDSLNFEEWIQLAEKLLPIPFDSFAQNATSPPPCDIHDPNCKKTQTGNPPCSPHDPACHSTKPACDPHDPACTSGGGDPGHHGGGEMEAWMKRMLYMLLTTMICTIVALLFLLALLVILIRSRKNSSKL